MMTSTPSHLTADPRDFCHWFTELHPQSRPLQENKGHRKVLASVDINLKRYASATPTQTDLTLKLKPLSVKVVEASLRLSLSCVFVREGKAT